MADLTRKGFLGLSAGLAASAAALPAAAKSARRTLIKGADLLTMDPKLGEISGGDVLIEGGKIIAIGKGLPTADAEVIDAKGFILMPGMSDGHRHVWEGYDAGRLVKTEPQRFKSYQDWKMRVMVCLTPEDHHFAGYLGGLQALDSGVTAVLDYAHGQHTADKAVASAKGLKDSGIAGWFCYQVSHSPSYGPGDTVPLAKANAERSARDDEAHWKAAEMVRDLVLSDSQAPLQFGIAFSNGSMGSPMPDVKREWARARSTGAKMLAAHNATPAKPYPAGHMGARGSGIPDLHEAGLLGPDYHISHGVSLTDDELAMIRDAGVMICATPMGEVNYLADRGGAPVHARARKAGCAVGMGIDIGVSLTQDYFEHVRGAFWNLYQTPVGTGIASGYKSEDALDFATRLGSKALRLGDVAGTITVGKRADLVLLDTRRIGFANVGSLADRVVNFAMLPDVDSVWVAGKRVKAGGKMIGVDWTKLKAKQAEVHDRVWRQAQTITFT